MKKQVHLLLLLGLAAGTVACGATSSSEDDATPAAADDSAAGDDGSAGVTEDVSGGAGSGDDGQSADGCSSFEHTFEAIQEVIFERHGCTASACHGDRAAGGLDLRAEVAYQNLFDVQAKASDQKLVSPGLPSASFLYQKLRAATDPGSVQIAGSPMPIGTSALSAQELEALRIWIGAGAPETGSVGDASRQGSSEVVGQLLGACLPPAESVSIAPLAAPAAEEGIQIEMPVFTLDAGKEVEVCFATYYDFTDKVPAQFKSEDGSAFYINGLNLRQDANSHHFIVANPGLDASAATDPSFGKWICYGGERAGGACDPLLEGDCGADAHCATELMHQVTCSGFGPVANTIGFLGGEDSVVASQTAQHIEEPRDGVYRPIPIKGFLYFNAHAFNLATNDHPMHSRFNLYYTDDLRARRVSLPNFDKIFGAAGTPPFEKATICAQHVMPQGAELIGLTSHTHKRGEHFWAENAAGDRIYESFSYSDPVYKEFEPSVVFDSADQKQRTIKYCATFNNGVFDDGTPDVSMVTRASTMPERTSCEPVACVAGKIGAPCGGAQDHAACDSSPGASDGLCDACPITGGPTTENTMFALIPTYIEH